MWCHLASETWINKSFLQCLSARPPGPGTRCHVTLSPLSRAGSGLPGLEMRGIVQTDHQECEHHLVQTVC